MQAAFLLDHVGHTRRPQVGFIAESLRPTLQTELNAPQILRTKARPAPGSAGFLQRPPSPLLQLLRPSPDRLPACSYAPGDLRLAIALLQQPLRLHPPLL